MKRTIYRTLFTVALATAAAAQTSIQNTPRPSSPPDVITTADDEVTVENNIESYLNRKGLKTMSSLVRDNAKVIGMRFAGKDGQPNYEFRITSSPANPERVVLVWLMTGIQITDPTPQILGALTHASASTGFSWFVNPKTNELTAQYFLVIPGPESPVPTELIYNALARMSAVWAQLFLGITHTLQEVGPHHLPPSSTLVAQGPVISATQDQSRQQQIQLERQQREAQIRQLDQEISNLEQQLVAAQGLKDQADQSVKDCQAQQQNVPAVLGILKAGNCVLGQVNSNKAQQQIRQLQVLIADKQREQQRLERENAMY